MTGIEPARLALPSLPGGDLGDGVTSRADERPTPTGGLVRGSVAQLPPRRSSSDRSLTRR